MPDAEPAVAIREARAHELPAATSLLAEALGFGARDAIPPWLVSDAQESGGVALVAARRDRIVGFSFALPALGDDGPYLFSCGLAVVPELRARGLGRRLKAAQRDAALRRGHRVIRWRADPLDARALHVYLDRLGARLTGYRAQLYVGVRDDGDVPHDDVDVEWRLDGATHERDGVVRRVELPWDRGRLDGEGQLRWRLAVREQTVRALDAGAAGVAVELDRDACRAWLCLEVQA